MISLHSSFQKLYICIKTISAILLVEIGYQGTNCIPVQIVNKRVNQTYSLVYK